MHGIGESVRHYPKSKFISFNFYIYFTDEETEAQKS